MKRETDAEILTRRGGLKIEIGLIMAGNQGVIEDKIGRMNRNDIIVFDKIGARSRIMATAARRGVKLIPIRNNNILNELHEYFQGLADIPLNDPPNTNEQIDVLVAGLPDNIFHFFNPWCKQLYHYLNI